ncbi:MAG: SLC13 family permease [Micrococcales bacterium]|nr:SLC13 family permease [Micrococcales bacterium]
MGIAGALAALVVVLAVAIARPRNIPEWAVAVPVALVLVATRTLSLADAWAQIRSLAPVVAFLAGVLVLGQLCEDEGLFGAAGRWMARASRSSPTRLLTAVVGIAAVTTAALSLDATVVLLTPVVFATAARIGARSRPHVYASAHLANSASLLLPVSNLTNLLAFRATGLSFLRFAGLMALPWLLVVALERLAVGRYFRADLAAATWVEPTLIGTVADEADAGAGSESAGSGPADEAGSPPTPGAPGVAIVVVAATLAGFVVASAVGIDPAWAAAAGAVVLACHALARRRSTPSRLARSVNLPFLAFVLALGVVVRAVIDNGLSRAVRDIVPSGSSFAALLLVAAIAALLANVVNNLPAILLLLPLLAGHGTGPMLAALIGVNVGPNLTYVGSLATLLWRRIARTHHAEPRLVEYHLLGAMTVPASIVVATSALWVGLTLMGGG